jgi:two-component system, OmpR family, response regulator VicR
VAKEKIKLLIGLEEGSKTDEILANLKTSYNVEMVYDSEEAYQKIHVFDPDIAILDYALSKIHPIELYEGISMVHFHLRVVICVNNENLEVASRIWKQRAIDFILKPFTAEQFVLDVNKVVRHVLDLRENESLKKKIVLLENELSLLKKAKGNTT